MKLMIDPKGDKGRSFRAELVSYATADTLWNGTDTNAERPIWAVFAGPTEELRAFVENLRLGNPASTSRERGAKRFEFIRSAPYRWWVRALPADGSCATVVHPSILGWQQPVEDNLRLRFAVLPALSWLAAQRFDEDRARVLLDRLLAHATREGVAVQTDRWDYDSRQYTYKTKIDLEVRHDKRLIGESLHDLLGYGALLLHYLDHRLPLPLPRDPVFGTWLLLLGHYEGRCLTTIHSRRRTQDRYGEKYVVDNPDKSGCAEGFIFHAGYSEVSHLSEWLGREVQRWFAVGGAS